MGTEKYSVTFFYEVNYLLINLSIKNGQHNDIIIIKILILILKINHVPLFDIYYAFQFLQ